jgi:hypothetical protein
MATAAFAVVSGRAEPSVGVAVAMPVPVCAEPPVGIRVSSLVVPQAAFGRVAMGDVAADGGRALEMPARDQPQHVTAGAHRPLGQPPQGSAV